ncbi:MULTISPECIES: type II toxin-antitoxin system Phd/YefM family antitoxin [Erwinia]|uniref:StbD n=3 Tax=Erwinia TaxID=551 RepID=Q7X3U3_9GAMM|nr:MULTISPECIES: plasmid stabilization protein [Erwinia]AAN04532.1 putative plasmid stability protein StbD [Erwinia pyrifoliae Ep1/96]AAP51313.1 StbD [Erwinia sp. Ejp 556]AUX74588.1 plasmid stabilization protein [Erwinia pyrifoliae]AUX74616.1 plasmid stabilization protein [Erwinia pyrifoliae]MCA8878326.1 plasmid stabilization protein [Erwinia pyrifoliae]
MAFNILTNTAASITDLKRDPMGTVRAAEGETIAILNRNEPAFYCVPPAMYAYLMELAEDAELGCIVDDRMSELPVAKEISLDDL